MNKRSRFFIIVAVLAVCFVFLWPSIQWYARTTESDKAVALKSLEGIRDYAKRIAEEDYQLMIQAIAADPDVKVEEGQLYIVKQAKKNAKAMGKSLAKDANLKEVLLAFGSSRFSTEQNRDNLLSFIEGHYRDKILKDKSNYANSVKLGLDLSGGLNIIVKADLDTVLQGKPADATETDDQYKERAMEQAIQTLTSRIDRFGLSEPVIRQQGEDRIYIEMPGAQEADSINAVIMGKGILNFRLVDNDATNAFHEYYAANRFNTFDDNGKLLDSSIIPEDCEVLGYYTKDKYDLDVFENYIVVKKDIVLDGNHVKSADVAADSVTGKPEVRFVLDSEGATLFGDFTASHVNQQMAIISDGKIKSYATIRSAITGGRVAVENMSAREATNLQKVLQTAWLAVPLSVESQQMIGSSLGQLAIKQGVMALAIGLLSVMLFMIVYFKGAGFNAVVAQVLNLYILFSVLSAFNLTLSLSSIAGMILTIGMAVDANVIIFERIKEELRQGKQRAFAIGAGFDNAFWAIMDSNITTFIAAMFLSQLGSGAIQGFAVSLAIGVVSSVFTALVVSRLMFDFNTDVMHKRGISISWRIK